MGKKRRSNGNKAIGEPEVDDDEISFSLAIAYLYQNKVKVFMLMVIGFCIGSGSGAYMTVNPNDPHRLQTAYQRWSTAMGKRAPLEMREIGRWLNNVIIHPSGTPHNVYDTPYSYIEFSGRRLRDDPSHPITFAMLREAIIREDGGYVHPDLGLLIPAPCGATRGIGMVRDSYNSCQTRCMPGILPQKQAHKKYGDHPTYPPFWNSSYEDLKSREEMKKVIDAQLGEEDKYRQEEILIKVPLSYQMTRSLALKTLQQLLPQEVNLRAPLQELDDAALLVLLLAHERGLGRQSKFQPYISSLPVTPSCGYAPGIRAEVLDTISLMDIELGMNVFGWSGEIGKASDRALMIADGLAKDYGQYIAVPQGSNAFSVMQWALCQVASRATAGSDRYGALRLVPMIDMVNHDINAGGFIELAGNEKLENNNIIDATESDIGAFVVRSIRHGRRKPLKKGQELLVNYNVPNYSPLDWFLSLGFVPTERREPWKKVEGHFKKPRTFATEK